MSEWIEKLGSKIADLKKDGVIDIRVHLVSSGSHTKEQVAKSIIDLMDAEEVNDPDLF